MVGNLIIDGERMQSLMLTSILPFKILNVQLKIHCRNDAWSI